MQTDRIPLTVGVTGSRVLRPEDGPALAAAVKRELEQLHKRYPSSPLVMLSSLAEGADQLCAGIALETGIPLVAVLPLEKTEYEKDFCGEALDAFRSLCARADRCFTAPATEPVPASPERDFFYRQAGIYVASHCHVLLALWDGAPGKAGGCGTAETVSFALSRDYHPVHSSPLFSATAVIHVFTPRGGPAGDAPGTVRVLGDTGTWRELMDRTEEFNALADGRDPASRALLPKDREADPVLDRIESVYGRADRLSLRYAETYRRILVLLAVLSTLVTASFLLYDEANLHFMILVCGLALLGAWFLQRFAKRSSCHRRYIEYRVLAESLRVQAFLRYAGSGREAVTLLPWTQQTETPWIAAAMTVLGTGGAPGAIRDILACWPEGQLRYHTGARETEQGKLRGSSRVVGIALAASVFLYAAALVFELLFGGLLFPDRAMAGAETCRTILKLVLGAISAATLFISNYYGKQSLSRSVSDHGKMAGFYGRIAERARISGLDEDLLLLLAREELIENGNWCSYQRDNAPDFSL